MLNRLHLCPDKSVLDQVPKAAFNFLYNIPGPDLQGILKWGTCAGLQGMHIPSKY